MQNATYLSAARLVAQQDALDIIANNIANANTIGYKSQHPSFGEFLTRQTGVDAAPGGANVTYPVTATPWRDLTEGTLEVTANPLDVALGAQGYFTVETAQGPRLTRAGRFTPSGDGQIVDLDGNALLDSNGQPLRVAPTDTRFTITGDGTISSENGVIGKIGVVLPDDPTQLQDAGGRLLVATGPTSPVTAPKITQGAVEQSNTQPIMEITRLITLQRDYQFVTQMLQTDSDRQMNAVQKIVPSGH